MDLESLASALSEFNDEAVFLRCDPEIIDFRKPYKGEIVLSGSKKEMRIKMPEERFSTFAGILSYAIFEKKVIFSWDIKKLFSYFYHRLVRKHFIMPFRLFDIKYGEFFCGIRSECPKSFSEAQGRIKAALKGCWEIHQKIHIPLAVTVLPKIETLGIRDSGEKKIRYPIYEIEGQLNGRLGCSQTFPDSISVYTLQKEARQKLRPGQDSVFVVLDFKSTEAHVLQFLSKDERLGKIIESGRDIYSTIYSLLYGQKCTPKDRQFIKDSFLPIVYGMQATSLAERVGITQDEAAELILNINKYFSVAMGWVQNHQDRLKAGEKVADYFGRIREYDKPWAIRNAVIQGPAAIVCQEKLIDLHSVWEVAAAVHDGYYLDVPRSVLYETVFRAVEVLEKPSRLMPGFKLPVEIKVGENLEELNNYNL